MEELRVFRDNLKISLDSIPRYEDIKYLHEFDHTINPILEYIYAVVERNELDIEVDHRIFNYMPLLFSISYKLFNRYSDYVMELEQLCMTSIVQDFHLEKTETDYKTVLEFLRKVEKKVITIRRFILLYKPYVVSEDFERCRKSVNVFSQGLAIAFTINEA